MGLWLRVRVMCKQPASSGVGSCCTAIIKVSRSSCTHKRNATMLVNGLLYLVSVRCNRAIAISCKRADNTSVHGQWNTCSCRSTAKTSYADRTTCVDDSQNKTATASERANTFRQQTMRKKVMRKQVQTSLSSFTIWRSVLAWAAFNYKWYYRWLCVSATITCMHWEWRRLHVLSSHHTYHKIRAYDIFHLFNQLCEIEAEVLSNFAENEIDVISKMEVGHTRKLRSLLWAHHTFNVIKENIINEENAMQTDADNHAVRTWNALRPQGVPSLVPQNCLCLRRQKPGCRATHPLTRTHHGELTLVVKEWYKSKI